MKKRERLKKMSFRIQEESNMTKQPKPISQEALDKLNALKNISLRDISKTKTAQPQQSIDVGALRTGFSIVPVMNENNY